MSDVTQPVDALRAAPKWESANLDVLRTLAVAMVVVFHFLEFFQLTERGDFVHQLGQWGVLLFFVHTSLVLMLSLERQSAARYQSPYLAFVVRRIFRIYPLSVAVVAAVCAFHWPVGDTVLGQFVAAPFDWKAKASNVLLIQNLTHSQSVMATLWTLPYEMQMYLVLPLLFSVARYARSALPLLGIWLVAALLARALHSRTEDFLAYVPCFVSGVVGYKLLKQGRGTWPFWGWLLVLFLTTLLFLKRGTTTSAWACCLIVGAMVARFRELRVSWLRRTCQLVARYSYGIYLSHYRAAVAAREPAAPGGSHASVGCPVRQLATRRTRGCKGDFDGAWAIHWGLAESRGHARLQRVAGGRAALWGSLGLDRQHAVRGRRNVRRSGRRAAHRRDAHRAPHRVRPVR
jgi:peptidoglycan/LPS O-acetylase OafA/YrhL